jgi:pimeloyl-ACP methyl ester carboxylesterase
MAREAVDAVSVKSGDAVLSTGVRLRYVEQGDPDGPAVVALHGITDSSFSFSPLLPLLPPALRVIAPDQRGHGESERPRDGYAMRDLGQDVLALMDALGIARATLVGHSMGTFVAREAALIAPDRISGLLLLGAGATGRGPGVRELWRIVETMVDPIDPKFVYEFQAGTIHRQVAPEFLARVVEESLKVPARVWRAALASIAGIESAAACGGIRCPTRLVWGDRDATFLRDEQDELARLIPGATLEILPVVGHAVHWEAPEAVGHVLRAMC